MFIKYGYQFNDSFRIQYFTLMNVTSAAIYC